MTRTRDIQPPQAALCWHRRRHVAVSLTAIIAAVLMVAGCGSGNRPAGTTSDTDRVTLADLAPADRPGGADPPKLIKARSLMGVQRVDLPLNGQSDGAWQYVNTDIVPPLARLLWRANGLRLGVLHRDDLPAFTSHLTMAMGTHQSRMLVGEHPMPIIRSPRLRKPLSVDLTVPPLTIREQLLSRGRVKLLATIVDPTPPAAVRVVPLHFVPRTSIVPRSPLEKELDGQIIDELAVDLTLADDELLVVGLHHDWPKPKAPPAADGASDETTGDGRGEQSGDARADDGNDGNADGVIDADGNGDDEPALAEVGSLPPGDVPEHLGRSLLVTRRLGKPAQIMLIISVAPWENQPNAIDGDADALAQP